MSQQPTCKRAFILGAGFSKAAGMPLSTKLTRLVIKAAIDDDDEEKIAWLSDLRASLSWMQSATSAEINIEELFHYASLVRERWAMRQQLCTVGRGFGPATPFRYAEMIAYTLDSMTRALARVIWQKETDASLDPIKQFAKHLCFGDGVLTFNYDTLLERALTSCGIPWHHGLNDMRGDPSRVVVLKMHGSVDWVQLERGGGNPSQRTLLFSKTDENVQLGHKPPSTEPEYHWELWRVNEFADVKTEIERRNGLSDYASISGMAGLGSHKPLALLSGSGLVWERAMGAILEAEEIYIVGFSLAPFDAMSRLLLAECMRQRHQENRMPRVVRLVDPNADSLLGNYLSVFQTPMVIDKRRSQDVDWAAILSSGSV